MADNDPDFVSEITAQRDRERERRTRRRGGPVAVAPPTAAEPAVERPPRGQRAGRADRRRTEAKASSTTLMCPSGQWTQFQIAIMDPPQRTRDVVSRMVRQLLDDATVLDQAADFAKAEAQRWHQPEEDGGDWKTVTAKLFEGEWIELRKVAKARGVATRWLLYYQFDRFAQDRKARARFLTG